MLICQACLIGYRVELHFVVRVIVKSFVAFQIVVSSLCISLNTC